MKSYTPPSARARIQGADVKQFNIEGYDVDNGYPQRIIGLVNASGTAKQAVALYAKFIVGGGFNDLQFYRKAINQDGVTADKLLRMISKDRARFNGFAIHVNYNAAFYIKSLHHVPFENVRKALSDSPVGKGYAITSKWFGKKRLSKDEIDYIHAYNPDPEVIADEVASAGGWQNYNGQILYFSADDESYPLASCDAVIEPIKAEIAGDVTTTSNLENNFTAKVIFWHAGKLQSDKDGEELANDLKEFVGPDGSQVMVLEDLNQAENFKSRLEPVSSNLNDKLFAYTDEKVFKKIIRHFNQPGILHSYTAAGMFNQQQLEDAMSFYNGVTMDERYEVEEVFAELCSRFLEKLNASGDYSVKPLSYAAFVQTIPSDKLNFATRNEVRASMNLPELDESNSDKKLLIDTLGASGVQALQSILIDTTLTPEQKINTLKVVFGISDTDARLMVYGKENA